MPHAQYTQHSFAAALTSPGDFKRVSKGDPLRLSDVCKTFLRIQHVELYIVNKPAVESRICLMTFRLGTMEFSLSSLLIAMLMFAVETNCSSLQQFESLERNQVSGMS
jgi:hypothetical protein